MRRKPESLELDSNEETMNAFYLTTGQRLTFTALMRWMFYINFLIVCFMPRSSTLGAFRTQFHKIDFIGIFLFVTSASSFLIPLSWGGIMFPWNSWHTLAALILGIMGLVAFGAYDCLYSTFPLIPPVIFRNKSTATSLIGYFAMGFLLWCELYYLPLYFEAVKGYNSIIAGVALFPATLTIAPIAILTGSLITVTGNCYWTILTSWPFCTLGLGLLCLLQVETSTPAWIFLCMVSGLGFGTGMPAIAVAVQASDLPEHVSIAITLSTFSRSFGQALGVAVGGATFENRGRTILLQNPRLASVADRYSRDAFDVLNFLGRTNKATRFQIRSAYVQSLRAIWAIGVGVSGITLIEEDTTKGQNFES
ncbi:uncharacterized protein N7473_008962 [Penicillium subrubescens]|uniref:uncharacterized protein n=1 Tax=Penicillium subrubescens TaxID=1316194 RepID=UPI002545A52C|nr:uncharacterized protein N7473_008962 [Penicillium subrubescens]KAJ5886288.1 hypothetical protein N7473_008962 [Penicillium subrubescens]